MSAHVHRLLPMLVLAAVCVGCDGQTAPSDVDTDPACAPTAWFPDGDGDGAGSPFGGVEACEAPEGMVDNADDCDDSDAAQLPGAVWYLDEDGDRFGDPATSLQSCLHPLGYVADNTDCDDADPTRNPDGSWYEDGDGDGFGDAGAPVPSCGEDPGPVANAEDCDDADAAVHPDANEICDAIDNDCDELIDDADVDVDIFTQVTIYRDDDGDGYGIDEILGKGCPATAAGAVRIGDCDDSDASVFPEHLDYFDGIDGNCDGREDEHEVTNATPGWRSDVRNEGFANSFVVRDLDGDGLQEALISETRFGADVGRVRLLAGRELDGPTSVLDGLDGVWTGSRESSQAGIYLALHDDLDQDGIADILVVDHGYERGTGRVYLISADAEDGTFEERATAIWDHSESGAELGRALLPVGDHLLVAARRANTERNDVGRVYIVDNSAKDLTSLEGFASVDGIDGGDRLGWRIAEVGDTDGDGVAEIGIAAINGDNAGISNAGEVYLLPVDAFDDGMATLEDADHVLLGQATNEQFGWQLAGAGDVNGDGRDDIAVGCPFVDHAEQDAGTVYVVAGSATPPEQDGARTAHWTIQGGPRQERIGESLIGPGDIDGDGDDDLLIGAPMSSRGGIRSGSTLGILSDTASGTWVIDRGEDDPGLWIVGEGNYDALGRAMQAAGDVNGDGLADTWVSAPGGYNNDGALYLILGAMR